MNSAELPDRAFYQELDQRFTQKANELGQIQPKPLERPLDGLRDLEQDIRATYKQKLAEQSRVTFGTRKTLPDSEYEGDLLGDERHGFGKIKYNNGRQYIGEWRQDTREGRGIEQYSNGNRYMGDFSGGIAHGYGIYTWNNGEVYQGDWVQGSRHGFGRHHRRCRGGAHVARCRR